MVIKEGKMKIYLVGGAVRDEILGKKPHDRDYVVVGATVEEMLSKGYKQVGKDFPVFLHPITKDEYALARKAVKTGDKHTDFKFEFGPDITLEEDIQRRDFTINALAKDIESGEIIDLVGGIDDLKNGIIRHVNDEHFAEDPLRVLRMCRFAAKLDFKIAPETMKLAKNMVDKGMIDHLTPERIWKEIEKALETDHFDKFILTAKECGALKVILPEINKLWEMPEKLKYHPEGNSGDHTILVLKQGHNLSPKIKFALLMHDVGKTQTPAEILPAHHGHDKRGLTIITDICKRLRIPNEYRNFALLGCKYHMAFHELVNMRDSKALEFVSNVSHKFKDENQLNDFIELCRCDAFGRKGVVNEANIAAFNEIKEKVRIIFNKASKVHANDMPNFDELQKRYITGNNTNNRKFAQAYQQYLLEQVFSKHC